MKSKRILWVEDDPDDRELIGATLELLGVSSAVHFEADGERALRFLAACDTHALPTAIILDFEMPKMKAREVIDQLRERPDWSRIPVVIFTSSPAGTLGDCGGVELRTKPIDAVSFRRAVDALIGRWL